MNLRFRRLIAGMAICVSLTAHAQSSSTAPTDIYTNFVGIWVGTQYYVLNGVAASTAVKIEISEDKKKDRLRFAYTYAEKGQNDYSHATKFLKLDLKKKEVAFWWSEDFPLTCQAKGLDEFAKVGFGSFVATAIIKEEAQPGITRFLFTLEPNNFEYGLDRSLNGQPFVSKVKLKIHRDGSANSSNGSP